MIKIPVNTEKKDLRSIKTEKALDIAIFSLLECRNFQKITVSDICKAAQISRATFYAHFTDKYDLLKNCLIRFEPRNISNDDPYEHIEKVINELIHKNKLVIKNIVFGADNETLEILFNSILSTLNLTAKKSDSKIYTPKHIVLSNFYAGGMVYYLLWQVKNKFPLDVMPMNIHLYEMIEKFQEWKLE